MLNLLKVEEKEAVEPLLLLLITWCPIIPTLMSKEVN
jgi:hypothetical protein